MDDAPYSVVQLYSEAFDASFDDVIRLCSGFGQDDDSAAAGIVANGGVAGGGGGGFAGGGSGLSATRAGETFESLEEWHKRHTAAHEASLARLERRRDALAAEVKLAGKVHSHSLIP